MIATFALLTALAAVDAPAPATVWMVAEPAARSTMARVTNELRALGCEVRAVPLDGPSETIAERLLSDEGEGRPLVVIVRAAPAPVEVWWWSDTANRPAHDVVPFAATSDEPRLGAIRVAEAVRARLALAIEVAPVSSRSPPAIVPVAPAEADAPLVVRLAVGPTLSRHVEAEPAAGLALAVAALLSRHTAGVLTLNMPLATIDWDTTNGTATTRDYVAAALIEGRIALPGALELRGAAGASFHARVSHGVAPSAPSLISSTTSFTAGPALTAAIAYRVQDTFGLVATAAADATYPDRDVHVDNWAVGFPGRVLWSLGLLAELEF
jgi:hypothetical protein